MSIALLLSVLLAGVPESGSRHDQRRTFLELGVSANGGTPDVGRPQLELMVKRRGWPVFASGRLGIGMGFWGDHGAIVAQPQMALHWTRDGEDSWAIRLGWAMGEWFGSEIEPDTSGFNPHYATSNLTATVLALERTAYFGASTDFAWRVALGVAAGFHRYELRGTPREWTDILQPLAEVGLVWTAF